MGPSLAYDHVRRRAALAGIEARHPLVDVDVLELMFRLPPEHAYSSAHSRPLLRQALAGLLPDEVRLRRTKSNFDAVFHEGLAGPDLPALRALLGADDLRLGDYVVRDAVQGLLERPPSAGPELSKWAMRVWRLATAELWLRVQEDGDGLNRLLEPLLAAPDLTVEG
jgi:asparagine synthase (glutamine-hydrolysing)